jgi:aldose 1-epimerase
MGRIRIQTDRLRLEIDPAVGAGVTDFSLRHAGAWQALMRPAPGRPGFNDVGCYLLAPWSNRIAGARFVWRSREHALRADWPDGTAIHGLVKDRPWRIAERTPLTATLELDSRDQEDLAFPWAFSARVRYEVTSDALSVRLGVCNASSDAEPMPAGLGFHPFFPRSLRDTHDEARIRYTGRGRYPAAGMIPTGSARPDEVTAQLAAGVPVSQLVLDDVFLGSAEAAAIAWPASGVRLTYACSPSLSHAVIYTGRLDSFCFEPVTMVNDGFNLASQGWSDTGVAALGPGESLVAEWTLHVDTV